MFGLDYSIIEDDIVIFLGFFWKLHRKNLILKATSRNCSLILLKHTLFKAVLWLLLIYFSILLSNLLLIKL